MTREGLLGREGYMAVNTQSLYQELRQYPGKPQLFAFR